MTNVLDPRDEVRKLQDLVRQLELQNAQLRSKQQARRKAQSPPLKTTTAASNRRRGSVTDKNENIAKLTLEDVDIIDVDAIDLSDEGSWLFSSPKKLTEAEKSISPYKWMRRDVEDPDNVELQTIKLALVNKLDEIARARYSGLEQLRSPVLNEPEREKSPVLKPIAVGFQRKIDSRTFTRPRKHREEFSAKIPDIFDVERVEPVGRVPTDADTPEDDCISTASDSSMSTSTLHRLADVVDVQALARLQEESLQEILPVTSSGRNAASDFPQASNVPVNNLENLYRQINENEPGKQNYSCSKSDSLDDSLSSDVSENLQTYESFDEDSTYSSTHRSSLPNASKHHQNGLPMRNTANLNAALPHRDPRLPNPQVAMCKPHTSRANNGNWNKDTSRDSSLVRDSRIPVQHSVRRDSQNGLPSLISSRPNSPSSRSAIPQLRRSGSPADVSPRSSNLPKPTQSRIPAPRSRSNLPTRSSVSQSCSVDESWKDGCF